MSINKKEWNSTMTEIFEMLDKKQLKTMVEFYENAKFKKELSENLIQLLGIDGSISLVNEAMQEIPRNDPGVQDLLRPFVEQLGLKQENQAAGPETRSHHEQTDLAEAVELKQNQDRASQVTKSPQRKSIKDLKASGDLGQKILAVKVVQKSDLAKFTKHPKNEFYFHVAVADETGTIKVVVFGKERYSTIQEGSFYILREVFMDKKNIIKVTEKAKISRTSPFDIPKNMELEAEKLLGLLFTISEVKGFEDKKEVSVIGTVKEIGKPMEMEKVNTSKQDFKLEDETGSITISLWGDRIPQLEGISIGDVVQVPYLMTNHYKGTVSLNNTDLTRINKKVTINIMGISEADKNMTELDVEISNQMKMLEVSSPLLAEVFGLSLDDNFQSKLLEKIPCELEAEIQGNKIKNLKAKA